MADSLVGLAAKISELTATFAKQLEQLNIPEATLDADSPTNYQDLSGEAFLVRQALHDALMDMVYRTQGPSESIFNYVHTSMPDVAVLTCLNAFNFWSAVPLDSPATYTSISQSTHLPLSIVHRLLDHATTMRLFAPAGPASVIHTSRSAAIAKEAGLRALISTLLDDASPPMTMLHEALRRYSLDKAQPSEKMDETAFALFHASGAYGRAYATSWDFIENDGEGERKGWRQRNFTQFMRYIKDIFDLEKVMLEAFDWEAAGNATVVDVGGSGGHDSIALAHHFPNLRITVQDLPQAEPAFHANLPPQLSSRLSFHQHSFFQPQPLAADIYLLKLILHDWPDAESLHILRAFIPAMRPGARILLIDYIGKQAEHVDEALPRSVQAMGTATDVRMLALFATRERRVEEWKDLFQRADERFVVERVKAEALSFMVVMEVVWRP
ncbi:hypothetical protein CDD81_7699 [Ophiocordyceps australis]|uniref:O-methyltransferase C-terminal domain-containing protein n=1 Tax=Ophiocordyceps australis TaxID=1399860 RepID=A0A2C5Y3G0_9HYPO|nr:hypothetical protein CDD81_7699 [Ophiocordyceps australis]